MLEVFAKLLCWWLVRCRSAGELGSLGGSTHLHGFTCAAAVLRSVTSAATEQLHAADAQRSSSSSSDAQRGSGRATESSSAAEPGSTSEAAGTGRLEPGEDKA
jgi:hypothetical protein